MADDRQFVTSPKRPQGSEWSHFGTHAFGGSGATGSYENNRIENQKDMHNMNKDLIEENIKTQQISTKNREYMRPTCRNKTSSAKGKRSQIVSIPR